MGRTFAIALAAMAGLAVATMQAQAGPAEQVERLSQGNCGVSMGNAAVVVIIHANNKVQVCENQNLPSDPPAKPKFVDSYSMLTVFVEGSPGCVTYYDSTGTERTFCQ